MRQIAIAVLSISLLSVTAEANQQPVVSVSSEPTGLTVESKAGKKIIPGIDVYADGFVAIRRYNGSEATKRLDKKAVDALLESLERTRFYKVSEDSFNAEVDKSHRPGEAERIFITDCPFWTLRIRHGGVTRSTKFYGLWDMAEHYPKSKQLKTLKEAFLMAYSAVGEKPF
jgi:hypothetical protein